MVFFDKPILDILREALFGSLSSMWGVLKIVIPLMLVIEIIKDLNILDRLSKFLNPIARIIGTSKESLIPLLSGLLFGILYGAGIIIEAVKEGNMDKREVYLVSIFLGACHAVFEDTLIFVQIGANGWIIFFMRLIAAFVITFLASRTKYFSVKREIDI